MKNKFDLILKNGVIFTSDGKNRVVDSLAIKDGRIRYCGSFTEIASADSDRIIDLDGKFVMPGIIDSHMHPFWGAKQLVETSLDYTSYDIPQIIEQIQKRLDQDSASDDDWLVVRAWLCIGGTFIDKSSLDKLKTSRPIVLFSNDCHYLALNSKGLEKIHILDSAPVPDNGVIVLDEHNKPTGLIEDGAAMDFFDKITAENVDHGVEIFEIAQYKLNQQGITTIMDARAINEEFRIFKKMEDTGKLKLRILGAYEVKKRDLTPLENFANWIDNYNDFVARYSNPHWEAQKASLCIHQAKFFVDGMIPSHTACLREPYFENVEGNIRPTDRVGQAYFSQEELDYAYLTCADLGIDAHAHTIADGAIDLALNAIEKVRAAGNYSMRPALAHCDVTAGDQYARFKALDVSANLSFQWSGYPQEMIDLHRDLIGEAQIETKFETHGKFFDAGVNVAYNSDWPIDPLNEWYNFQVGMTRRIDDKHPRLESDRNLTATEVIRAATINAAYALKKESEIGSLEVGKFADFIILDKNPLILESTEIASVKVLETWLGGSVVYKN